MVRLNELIINGRSTDSLPFYCVVETNSAPAKSEKKDNVFENEHTDGYSKQTIDAYGGKERVYTFYLHDVEASQVREFMSFVADEGWFKPADDDLKYYYVKSTLDFETLDAVNGYTCQVTFFCQSFGMESERTTDLGTNLFNHTNAPMYPLVEIRGQSGVETFLQIGQQRMTFKELQDVIYIECQPRQQNVYRSASNLLNADTRGPFFEIQPGDNKVTKGPGITSVKITERWGWR